MLDEAGVDFFEEAWNGSGDRGTHFEKGLRDGVYGFDVGQRGALKDVDVIESAAIDVGEREKRKRDIFARIDLEIVADPVHVGTKVVVREHDTLGLACGARGIDERSELPGENLRCAQAVGGDVRGAGGGDERFVAETFSGNIRADVGGDDLFEFRQIGADSEKFLQLRMTGDENDFCAAMSEDVGHAFGRFIEVNRDGDPAGTSDGEIGGVPFGPVRGEKTDAIAGLDTEFHKGGR